MRIPFTRSFPKSQDFGRNPAVYAKFNLKGHNGIDYAVPNGTPIFSPISGCIVEAMSDPKGYGNYLKIENDTEGALLAHLRNYTVALDQQIKEGDLIAYSDNTGFSSGPHLHFGYYKKPRNKSNGYSGYIDPMPHFNNTPLPVPSPQPMSDIQVRKLVQFDRTVNELHKAGLIPTADSEQFFSNPADEDKFTNLIKRLIRDAKANATPVDVEAVKELGRKSGIKQVQEIVAKIT